MLTSFPSVCHGVCPYLLLCCGAEASWDASEWTGKCGEGASLWLSRYYEEWIFSIKTAYKQVLSLEGAGADIRQQCLSRSMNMGDKMTYKLIHRLTGRGHGRVLLFILCFGFLSIDAALHNWRPLFQLLLRLLIALNSPIVVRSRKVHWLIL